MGQPPPLDPHEKIEPPNPDSLAAEGLGGSGQQGLALRLARYGTAKNRNHAMAGHLCREGLRPLADRLYECGSFLRFRHYLERQETRLVESRSCDVALLCPLCAIRRGGRMLRRYHDRIERLAATFDFYTLTLTVKNGENLGERFQHLRQARKKLWERARKGYGALASMVGALWTVEFTKGKDGSWHPHIHAIVAIPKGAPVPRYGEGTQLRDDWLDVTGDSFIVHTRPIEGSEGDRISALCESLKYALKFSTLTLADNLDAYFALKGKRLLASSGVFYGVPDDDALDDEPLDEPFIELLYRYAGARGYVLDSTYSVRASEGLDRVTDDGKVLSHGGRTHASQPASATVGAVQGDDHARASPAVEGGGLRAWASSGDARLHGHRAVRGAAPPDPRSG